MASSAVTALWTEPMAMLGEFHQKDGPSVIYTFECLSEALRTSAGIGGRKNLALVPPTAVVSHLSASSRMPLPMIDGALRSVHGRSRHGSAAPMGATPTSVGLGYGGGLGSAHSLPQQPQSLRAASMALGGGSDPLSLTIPSYHRVASTSMALADDSLRSASNVAGLGGVVAPTSLYGESNGVAASVVTPAAALMLNELDNCADFHSRTLSRSLAPVAVSSNAPSTTLSKASALLDWVSPAQSVASTLPRGGRSSHPALASPPTPTTINGSDAPAICGGAVTRTQLVCSDMLFGKNIVSGSYLRQEAKYKLQNVIQRATNGGLANAISIFTDANIGGVAALTFHLFDAEARGEKRPMLLLVTHPDPRELMSRISILGPYLTALAVDISAKSDELRQAENTNSGGKSLAQKKLENYHNDLRVAGFNGLLRTLRRELHDFFDIMLPATLSADSMGVLGTLLAKSKQQQERRESKRLSIATDNLRNGIAKGSSGDGSQCALSHPSPSSPQSLPRSGATSTQQQQQVTTYAGSYINDPLQFDTFDATPVCQRSLTERAIQTVIMPPFIARTDPQVYRSSPSIFIDMSSVAPPEVIVTANPNALLTVGNTSDNTPGASGAASCEPSATGAGFQRIGAGSVSAVLPSLPQVSKVVEDAPIVRPPVEEQDLFIETLQMEMNMLTAATAVTFQLQAPQRAPKKRDHSKANPASTDDVEGSRDGDPDASTYSGSVGGEGEEHSPTKDSSATQDGMYRALNDTTGSGVRVNSNSAEQKLLPPPSGPSTRRGSLASVAPLLPPQSFLPVVSEEEAPIVAVIAPTAHATPTGPFSDASSGVPFKSYHMSAAEASRALYHRFPCANMPPPKPLSANPSDYTPLHLLHREQRTRCVVVEVDVGGPENPTSANKPLSPLPLTTKVVSPVTPIPSPLLNASIPATTCAKPVRIPVPSKCGLLRNRMKELRLVPSAPVRPLAAWLLDAFWLLRDNLYSFRTCFAAILTAALTGGKIIVAGERAVHGGVLSGSNVDLSSTANGTTRHSTANGTNDYSEAELLQFQDTAASLAMSLTNLLPRSLQKTQIHCGEDDIIAGPSSNIQSLSADFMRESTIVQTSILSSNKQFVLSQLKPDGIVFVTVKPAHDVEYWEADNDEDESDTDDNYGSDGEECGGPDDLQNGISGNTSHGKKKSKPNLPRIRFPPSIGNVTNVDELYYKENPQEAYAKKALNEQAFSTAWRHHAASCRDMYPAASTNSAAAAMAQTLNSTANGSGRNYTNEPSFAYSNPAPSESVFGMQPTMSSAAYVGANISLKGSYGGPQQTNINTVSQSDAEFVASSEWRHKAPPPASLPFNSTKHPLTKDGLPSWRLRNSLEVMEAYGRKVYPTLVVDIIEKTIQMGTLVEQSIKAQQRRIYTAIQLEKAAKKTQQKEDQKASGGEFESPIKRTSTEVFGNRKDNNSDDEDENEGTLTLEEDILFVQLAGITDLSSILDSTTEQYRQRDVNTVKAYFDEQTALSKAKRKKELEERQQRERERKEKEVAAASGKSVATRRVRGAATAPSPANQSANATPQSLSPADTVNVVVKNTSFSHTDTLSATALLKDSSNGPLAGEGTSRPLTPRSGNGLSPNPAATQQQSLVPINLSEFAPNEVFVLQLALESSIAEAVSRGRLYLVMYTNLQYDLISNLERGGTGGSSTTVSASANDLPVTERAIAGKRHHHQRTNSTFIPTTSGEITNNNDGAAGALCDLIPEMPAGNREGAISFAVAAAGDNNAQEGTYGYRNVSHIDAARVAEAFSNTGSFLGNSSKHLSSTGGGKGDKGSRSMFSKIPVFGQFFKGSSEKQSNSSATTSPAAKVGDSKGSKPVDSSSSAKGNTTSASKQKELGDGFDFIRKEIQSNPKLRMVMKRWRYGVADDEILCFLGSVPTSLN